MKKLFILNALFIVSSYAEATCQLDHSPQAHLNNIINSCEREAVIKKFDYLPQYIVEKNIRCEILSKNSSDYQACQRELISFSSEIIQCENLVTRQKQMADYDNSLFDAILADQKSAEVPEDLKNKIEQMALYNNLDIEIVAYQSNVLNAHAGANNKILLSSGLWSKESPLTIDEVMAVVAHELSHIKENHSLKLGCLALEWSGSLIDLKEAQLIFREDFSIESSRGQSFTKKSKGVEYRADELAVSMLYESHYNPRLMGDALKKLIPKNEGGFSSGSHPDIELRIRKAYEYALEYADNTN